MQASLSSPYYPFLPRDKGSSQSVVAFQRTLALLGSWVNRGTLPTSWGRGPSPARRGGLRDHPGQQLRMREHRVVAGR